MGKKSTSWPMLVDDSERETKVARSYLCSDFGFPIKLKQAPLIKARGLWVLNVNKKYLKARTLHALGVKPYRLTGDEIRFIRQSLGLTLEKFGDRLDCSHAGVLKWEKCREAAPAIKWPTEYMIRWMALVAPDEALQGVLSVIRLKSLKPETAIPPDFVLGVAPMQDTDNTTYANAVANVIGGSGALVIPAGFLPKQMRPKRKNSKGRNETGQPTGSIEYFPCPQGA